MGSFSVLAISTVASTVSCARRAQRGRRGSGYAGGAGEPGLLTREAARALGAGACGAPRGPGRGRAASVMETPRAVDSPPPQRQSPQGAPTASPRPARLTTRPRAGPLPRALTCLPRNSRPRPSTRYLPNGPVSSASPLRACVHACDMHVCVRQDLLARPFGAGLAWSPGTPSTTASTTSSCQLLPATSKP